jgi:serine/threonine-protein kinase RsbT
MDNVKGEIKGQRDVVKARQEARDMARDLGFGSADQTRLATAISELTRNVIQHANDGMYIISDNSDHRLIRIQAVVEDNGPGIPDIEKALEYGYTTKRGLGAGLPGTKRLVNNFEIESKPGYTKVTISIAKQRRYAP